MVGDRLVVRNIRLLDLVASRPRDTSSGHSVTQDVFDPVELRERAA